MCVLLFKRACSTHTAIKRPEIYIKIISFIVAVFVDGWMMITISNGARKNQEFWSIPFPCAFMYERAYLKRCFISPWHHGVTHTGKHISNWMEITSTWITLKFDQLKCNCIQLLSHVEIHTYIFVLIAIFSLFFCSWNVANSVGELHFACYTQWRTQCSMCFITIASGVWIWWSTAWDIHNLELFIHVSRQNFGRRNFFARLFGFLGMCVCHCLFVCFIHVFSHLISYKMFTFHPFWRNFFFSAVPAVENKPF